MRLVLLHALPLDASMWPAELSAMGLPVDAPTLYDFGDTIQGWAAGVLDVAGPGPLVLVGSSVGGSCAIEIATLAPERVAAMVLVGAKAAHRPEPALRDEAVRVLTEDGLSAAWDRYWSPLFAPGADPAVVRRARSIALRQDVDRVVDGVRAFHGRPDRSAFLRDWPGQVVLVSGEHDTSPPPATMAELASTLRRGSWLVVPGAGHYVPLERPDALIDALAAVDRQHDRA